MKFFIAFFIGCLYYCVSKAQIDSNSSTGKEVTAKIHQLQLKKINLIVDYYIYCIGGEYVNNTDSCIAEKIDYLIWDSNKECFIQRFDKCKLHEPVIMNCSFLKLIRRNYASVNKEKIKYPEFYEIVDGKSTLVSEHVDHSCHTVFEIHKGSKILIKDIDEFALNRGEYDEDKHLNINYTHNQESILNKLKIIIEKKVKSLK